VRKKERKNHLPRSRSEEDVEAIYRAPHCELARKPDVKNMSNVCALFSVFLLFLHEFGQLRRSTPRTPRSERSERGGVTKTQEATRARAYARPFLPSAASAFFSAADGKVYRLVNDRDIFCVGEFERESENG
jgi:hypothetical protein